MKRATLLIHLCRHGGGFQPVTDVAVCVNGNVLVFGADVLCTCGANRMAAFELPFWCLTGDTAVVHDRIGIWEGERFRTARPHKIRVVIDDALRHVNPFDSKDGECGPPPGSVSLVAHEPWEDVKDKASIRMHVDKGRK